MDELWGEVRSACAAGLWSDAVQVIDVAARASSITPEQAADLLRYCARAASSSVELDAVADLSVAVLCESGEHWPWSGPESLLWDDDGRLTVGPYRLSVRSVANKWTWTVHVGMSDLARGIELTRSGARLCALRAARRLVIALVRQLF